MCCYTVIVSGAFTWAFGDSLKYSLRLVSSSSFNDAPLRFISFANFGHEEEKGKIILLSQREREERGERYSHINSNVDSTRGSGV